MTDSTLFWCMYWVIVFILLILIAQEALYLYRNHPRRYGKHGVWPVSGRYVPTKEASAGMDPSGGMRPLNKGPSSVEVGWWNGDIDQSLRETGQEIYDEERIPSPTVQDVGWWGDSM
jgi:hypothetical protein